MSDFAVQPVEQRSLPFHHDAGIPDAFGPRTIWMSDQLVAGAEFFVSVRPVTGLQSGDDDGGTELHTHEEAQLYLVMGEPGALTVEAEVAGQRSTVTSPASIYIRARAEHKLRIVSGTGTVIAILGQGTYVEKASDLDADTSGT